MQKWQHRGPFYKEWLHHLHTNAYPPSPKCGEQVLPDTVLAGHCCGSSLSWERPEAIAIPFKKYKEVCVFLHQNDNKWNRATREISQDGRDIPAFQHTGRYSLNAGTLRHKSRQSLLNNDQISGNYLVKRYENDFFLIFRHWPARTWWALMTNAVIILLFASFPPPFLHSVLEVITRYSLTLFVLSSVKHNLIYTYTRLHIKLLCAFTRA